MKNAIKGNQQKKNRNLPLFACVLICLIAIFYPQRVKSALIDDLICPDSEVRKKALYRFDSSDASSKEEIIARLIERSFNKGNEQYDYALEDLKAMGAQAIGPAIRTINDINLAERDPWVAVCLNSGKAAVPELKKYLGSDELHSLAAASLLLRVDPEMREAAAFISKKLKESKTDKTTLFCLRALSLETSPSETELQSIIVRLKSPDSIRAVALSCLDNFGTKASLAIPEVLKVLKSEKQEGRILPLKVLGNCKEAAYEAVPYLYELAAIDDIVLRLNVLRVIGEIGVDPKGSLPVLEASLKHEDEFVRAAAAEAVGRFDRKAFGAVPVLSEALMSSKLLYTQDKIIAALRAVGTEDALAAVNRFRKEVRQKKK